MNRDVHAHTPHLSVIDSRSLPVRQVAYWRRDADSLIPQALVTVSEYDTAGRAVAQRDPRFLAPTVRPNLSNVFSLSGSALFSHSCDSGWRLGLQDATGQPHERWDGRGNHWQHEYDPLRRPIATHEQTPGSNRRTVERLMYADNTAQFAERNQCGQVIRHDDRAGCLWLDQQALSGGLIRQTRRFLYEHFDVQADWPANEPDRDALLKPGPGYVSQNRFGPLGEVLVQTDAAGHRQQFSVDRAGQLQRIDLTINSQSPQPLLKAAHYNAEGQLLMQITGNDVTSGATYEASTGRLKRLTATTSEGACLQDLRHEYDPVGNLLRLLDHTQPVTFFANQHVAAENTYTYDSLSQLTCATGRETANAGQSPGLPELIIPSPIDPARLLNYTEHYEYDAGGNRTGLQHVSDKNPFRQQMRVDPHSNRALPWIEGDDEPDFEREFDANGNLQRLAPGAQPMAWDALNQLHSVTTVSRSTADDDGEGYRYDAAGERVVKFSSQQAHRVNHQRVVHYLPRLEVRTTDDDEELHVICIPLARGSVRCLHWVKGKPADIENDQTRYSVDDQLGFCSLELDKRAAVISQEGYYPSGGTAWWAARSKVDADYKTVRYSGKERDACGLYYYGFRYYAPWLGRWVSPDPAGAINGLNLYAFCGNNPVARVDPDGRMWQQYDDVFLNWFVSVEPGWRTELGLARIATPTTEEDESMDYQDSPTSLQSNDSTDGDSPRTPGSPAVLPPPTENQNNVLRILNAESIHTAHSWNSANLLERTNFGGKVYRADRRGPDEILVSGFNPSDDFSAIKEMIDEDILIVAETLEGALYFASQDSYDDRYYFYEIDAAGVRGASLLENHVLNNDRLIEHIDASPNDSPSAQTELAINMHEAHLSLENLVRLNRSVVSLGKLPDQVDRVRRYHLSQTNYS